MYIVISFVKKLYTSVHCCQHSRLCDVTWPWIVFPVKHNSRQDISDPCIGD